MRLRPLVLLWMLPATATATEWLVDPAGGGDSITIADALSAAQAGDRVLVLPGTYVESLVLPPGDVVLEAAGDASDTFLVAEPGLPALRIDAGQTTATEVRGFDISGGDTADGTTFLGGCVHVEGASPTLEGLVIHGCTAHVGAGMWLHQSSAELLSLELHDNTAVVDGQDSWGFGGGLYASESNLVALGLNCHDNAAVRGGGAMLAATDSTLDDAQFTANAADRGAGLVLRDGVHTVTATLAANTAAVHSGGLWVNDGATVALVGGNADGNQAGGAQTGAGGAVRVSDASLSATGWSATGNTALAPKGESATGGALRVDGAADLSLLDCTLQTNAANFGGALFVAAGAGATVESSWLADNSSVSSGGAAYVSEGELLATTTIFSGNVAGGDGGAVRAQAGDVELRNDLFVDNSASNGHALHLFDGSSGVFIHNTVAGGSASSGGAIRVTGDSAGTVRSSIIAFPATGSGVSAGDGADVDIAWNTVHAPDTTPWGGVLGDLTGTDGNGSDDPVFVAWTANGTFDDDLHLQAGSPAIDAADPAAPADPDGSPADQGAFGGPGAAAWEPVDNDGDGVPAAFGDCDDDDAAVFPGAEEACDGVDNDCNGVVDEGCGDDDDSAGDDDDAADDDDSGDDDDAADDDDVAFGDDDDSGPETPGTTSCGCTAAGSPLTALPLLLLGLRRRRALP